MLISHELFMQSHGPYSVSVYYLVHNIDKLLYEPKIK